MGNAHNVANEFRRKNIKSCIYFDLLPRTIVSINISPSLFSFFRLSLLPLCGSLGLFCPSLRVVPILFFLLLIGPRLVATSWCGTSVRVPLPSSLFLFVGAVVVVVPLYPRHHHPCSMESSSSILYHKITKHSVILTISYIVPSVRLIKNTSKTTQSPLHSIVIDARHHFF